MFRRLCPRLCAAVATPAGWTTAHRDTFNQDGIVCIPRMFSAEDVEMLKGHAAAIIEKEALRREAAGEKSGTVFLPNSPEKHAADRYFIESGNKVHFFLEDNCTEVSVATVNKIGHALHTDNGPFQEFCSRPIFGSIARQIGRAQPSVVQTMYILKPPHIGGIVSPHQDSTWINTNPFSCVGLWIALDDCTIQNGCLLAEKGSQWKPLTAHCRLKEDSDESTLHGTLPETPLDVLSPLECPKGSLVVFGGQTIHASAPNTSPNKRHAFVMHMVDDDCVWNEKNWLNPYLSRLAV